MLNAGFIKGYIFNFIEKEKNPFSYLSRELANRFFK